MIIKISWIPLILGIVYIMVTFGEPQTLFLIAIGSVVTMVIGLAFVFNTVDDLLTDFKSTIMYLITGLELVLFFCF